MARSSAVREFENFCRENFGTAPTFWTSVKFERHFDEENGFYKIKEELLILL